MADTVHMQVDAGIATLSIANPPINLLTNAVRQALYQAIDAAVADLDVHTILLTGRGEIFASGLELTQQFNEQKTPTLAQLCDRIAGCEKTVIAVVQGAVLGGALELALVAHARVAEAQAVFGFPAAALGHVPGAGATQRLPRLTGARNAITLLTTGRRISAKEAFEIGAIDRCVDAERWLAGRTLGGEIHQYGSEQALGRVDQPGFDPPAAYLTELEAARQSASGNRREVAKRIVECVEAAMLLPVEAGLNFERLSHDESLSSEQSRALRHLWQAERRLKAAAKIRQVTFDRMGIVGAGQNGRAILSMLAEKLPQLVVVDPDPQTIESVKSQFAGSGQSPVVFSTDYAALSESDFVLCVVADLADVPEDMFAQLDKVLMPQTTIAIVGHSDHLSNLALTSSRSNDVVFLQGLIGPFGDRLAEVVSPAVVSEKAVRDGSAFVDLTGRLLIRAGDKGGIANSLMSGMVQSCSTLLNQGASPYQVDTAMRNWGFFAGPFWMMDQIGLDVIVQSGPPETRRSGDDVLSKMIGALIERGRLGRPVGKGFYQYASKIDTGSQDPEVLEFADALSHSIQNTQQNYFDAHIQNVLLDALVNVGARLLEHRGAGAPSDIDLIMVHQFGFPRWRGGPMFLSDETGLLPIRSRLLRRVADTSDPFWQPAPLFDELIKNGRGFSTMNPATLDLSSRVS